MNIKFELHKTSQCGLRYRNEDVELFKLNLGCDGEPIDYEYSPIDLFIICDGHGGKEVAEYIAPELEKFLMNKKNTYPISENYINIIFDKIQRELIYHEDNIAEYCGSTCLILIRYHLNKFLIINIGDCRAVLSKNGLALPLTKDHKPFWPEEKMRIDLVNKKHNTNELIHFDEGDWRIRDLSVSRSFGDLDNTPYVTHIPDIFHYSLTYNDEFIIMACDGLWDVLENHEAINFIKDHINNNNIEFYEIKNKYTKNNNNIAHKLASYAIAKGSADNISIMIIIFN